MWRIIPPILVAATASAAASQECEDYSAHPHLLAHVPVPGTVYDVATVGSRAYVTGTEGSGGFVRVLDLSDPQHPVLGAAVGGFGWSYAIVAESGCLYALSVDGLQVLDLADPANPVMVGSLAADYGFLPIAVDVEGGIAYAVGGGRLDIVDVSDPTSPALLATIPGSPVSDVAATGSSLLTCSGPLLRRYDVTDPAVPVLVDSYEAAAEPYVESVGFASVATSGATVLTVLNHTYYDFEGGPVGRSAEFVTFDIADLSKPLGGASLGSEHSGRVRANANGAYVSSCYTGLHVVDVSSPSNPVVVHRNWAGPSGGMATLEVGGRRVLCETRGSSGVQVRDVTNPDRPHEVNGPGPGPYTPYSYHDVAAAEDLAYSLETFAVAGFGYGYALTAFDLSDPPNPAPVGRTAESYSQDLYKEVELAGGDLYLRSVGRLHRSRLTDPAQPEPPVRLEGLTLVRDIEAQDPLLWVARGPLGLLVLDASVPGDPAVIVDVPDHRVDALSVDGNRMGTIGGGMFRTVDVSDPAAPVFLGELPMTGSWLALRGDLAVVGGAGTLRFVDIGDAASPVELSWLSLPDASRGATFHGTRLYVAAGLQGLLVLDATDPRSPVIQGGLASDPALAVEIHQGWLLFAELGGFHVLPLACTATPGPELPFSAPASSGLSQVWPNPFVASTTIGYALDHRASVRLELFDVAGRRVRTLFAGARGVGRWTQDWDGLDGDGRPVPSGIYFLRLDTATSSATRRVTRLR